MRIKRLDYALLFIVALFLILGMSFLATISAPTSLKSFGTTNYYWRHQLVWGVLPGLALGLIAFLLPLSLIRRLAPILLFLNLVALCMVFLPLLGLRFWGANRWLNFGVAVVQPAEFLKLSFILYLASWFKTKSAILSKAKDCFLKIKSVLIPFIIFLAVIGTILYAQPDLTTLGIIGLTSLVIYFCSGMPKWHFGVLFVLALVIIIILGVVAPYRMARISTFLNPEADPMGGGYQFKQALIAIGSGGLGGCGIGFSSQKFGFLPQSMTDSTFAVIGEEMGFIGSLVLISLFLFLLWTGFSIAKRSKDTFSRLVCVGITSWILLQGFVNISAMIGLIPLGGIPLPFISYGGSHMVSELIAMGIMLNIARKT
ncbi:putative lipid II flippase FtsW [Patescibacteria group bacterium]|nr:putative lipid II flippase FtsW [Patescibacteria group bacterium]